MTGKLKEKREALGVSMNKLGELTGVAVPVISRIEAGIRPITLNNAIILSRALHCDPVELLPLEFHTISIKEINEELILDINSYLNARHGINNIRTTVKMYNALAGRGLEKNQIPAVIDALISFS